MKTFSNSVPSHNQISSNRPHGALLLSSKGKLTTMQSFESFLHPIFTISFVSRDVTARVYFTEWTMGNVKIVAVQAVSISHILTNMS